MLKNKRRLTSNNMNDIDIVILWVDGGDRKWLSEKQEYSGNVTTAPQDVDDMAHRYRDWGNLHFIFRGIETFAPWVRKVHFVTEGHVPEWLDLTNEKINHVKHEDFIPGKYLPTFSSHPIELNLHRIKDLAEKFIFFNDDMFITRRVEPSDFFRENLPVEYAVLNRTTSLDPADIFSHILLNDVGTINKNFNKNDSIMVNWNKWLTLQYGIRPLIQSALLMPYNDFPGLVWPHLPSAFLKSTFVEVWSKEPELLDNTSMHKFRHIQDVNQYLMKGWQMASGKFIPRNIYKNSQVFFDPSRQIEEISEAIRRQKYTMICINDTIDTNNNFDEIKSRIINDFEFIFPDKSSFEV